MFIYAVAIARAGTVKAEGVPELARAGHYRAQQVMLLVPFMVAVVALVPEWRQRGKPG